MLQHEAIKSYLEKAVPKCLSLKKQINICDELTCHIQDKADFYIEIGYDEEKSYEKALEEMGDGEEICQQFEEVYQEKIIYAVLTPLAIHFADIIAVILGFGFSFFTILANNNGMAQSSESILFSSVTLCTVLILIMYAHKERHSKMLKAIGISHLIMTFLTGALNSIYSPLIIAVLYYIEDRFGIFPELNLSLFGPIIISFPIGFICLILSKAVKYKKGLSEKNFKTLTALLVAGLVIVNCFSFTFNYSSISDYLAEKAVIDSRMEDYERITADMTFEEADKLLKSAGYIPHTIPKESLEQIGFFNHNLRDLIEKWSLTDNDIIYLKPNENGETSFYDPCIIIPQSQNEIIPWKIADFGVSGSDKIRTLTSFTIINPKPVGEAEKILKSLHIGNSKSDCIKTIEKKFAFSSLKTVFAEDILTETYYFHADNVEASVGYNYLSLDATVEFKNNRLSKGSYVLTHKHQELDDMGICFDVEEKEEHIIK